MNRPLVATRASDIELCPTSPYAFETMAIAGLLSDSIQCPVLPNIASVSRPALSNIFALLLADYQLYLINSC